LPFFGTGLNLKLRGTPKEAFLADVSARFDLSLRGVRADRSGAGIALVTEFMSRTIWPFISILLLWCLPAPAQISHLEVGAANYDVSDGSSPNRFKILELTAEDLIREYGPSGKIILNDGFPEALNMAANHLRTWLARQGYRDIEVETLLADYNAMEPPPVKTANLSNPGSDQLPVFEEQPMNEYIVRGLVNLARGSASGLKITSYYVNGNFDFVGEIRRYLGADMELLKINDNGYPYFHPAGLDLSKMDLPFGVERTSTYILRRTCESAL
jgi:hypothetical protein